MRKQYKILDLLVLSPVKDVMLSTQEESILNLKSDVDIPVDGLE